LEGFKNYSSYSDSGGAHCLGFRQILIIGGLNMDEIQMAFGIMGAFMFIMLAACVALYVITALTIVRFGHIQGEDRALVNIGAWIPIVQYYVLAKLTNTAPKAVIVFVIMLPLGLILIGSGMLMTFLGIGAALVGGGHGGALGGTLLLGLGGFMTTIGGFGYGLIVIISYYRMAKDLGVDSGVALILALLVFPALMVVCFINVRKLDPADFVDSNNDDYR
jgi:hypothetical protein